MGSVLFVLGGGIAYLMTHTITADDRPAVIAPEQVLAISITFRSHLEGCGRVR